MSAGAEAAVDCSQTSWHISGTRFACTPVTWGHMRRLLDQLHESFGPEYKFAPLHRMEGGVNCLQWPGGVSTEPAEGRDDDRSRPPCRKALRFEFKGWPSVDCRIVATNDWPLIPRNALVDVPTMLIRGEGQHSVPWTTLEMTMFGACIAAAFSWAVLISPGHKKTREIATGFGCTAIEPQSFAEWVLSLRFPSNNTASGTQCKYDAAPEVAEFLSDFPYVETLVDRRCQTFDDFRSTYLTNFDRWPSGMQNAARTTYKEWKKGPARRLNQTPRPVARPAVRKRPASGNA